ncbi:MAG: hypothetical protein JWQ38_3578 [Flavipsychrobacter sp.]|nr:hypothetical protein [Flavipsychrobacter sp.]
MKKKMYLSLLLLIPMAAIAQPTLVNSTTSPVAGDKFYLHDCDPFGVSKGVSGAGVTWNFSSLVVLGVDSMEYAPCVGTPYCDSFPGSNLSINYGSGYYEYYVTDTAKFAQNGDGDMSSMEYYPDPFALINYPMTYGTTSVDTMLIANYKGGYYSYGTDTMYGDGYGTLILPSGTYTNVLRVHMKLAMVDSDLSSGFPAIMDTSVADLYMWWQPGFHNPLLIMSYDTTGGGTLEDVAYFTKPATLVPPTLVHDPATDRAVTVYPNPASDHVYIHFIATTQQTISISLTDMLGRMIGSPVEQQVSQGAQDISYPVSSLVPGTYMLRLQTASGVFTNKLQVTR